MISNIPGTTKKTHRLENFLITNGCQKAYDAAYHYISGRLFNAPMHPFLIIAGECGRGKTHLALAIGWDWVDLRLGDVRYWQVESFLDQMRREYDSHGAGEDTFDQAERASLLILDDMGVEKATDWSGAKLDSLIDYRYINELHTVFTTNLALSQLPPRIASRLREGTTVMLKGQDWRVINKVKR